MVGGLQKFQEIHEHRGQTMKSSLVVWGMDSGECLSFSCNHVLCCFDAKVVAHQDFRRYHVRPVKARTRRMQQILQHPVRRTAEGQEICRFVTWPAFFQVPALWPWNAFFVLSGNSTSLHISKRTQTWALWEASGGPIPHLTTSGSPWHIN